MKNLTLKRILKKHQQNPQDEALHRIIETANVETKLFDEVVEKASSQHPFDKKTKS